VYLLDTTLVSELRRLGPHGGVVAWLASVALDGFFLSAVTLGELKLASNERGTGSGKSAEIEAWIEALAEATAPADGRPHLSPLGAG